MDIKEKISAVLNGVDPVKLVEFTSSSQVGGFSSSNIHPPFEYSSKLGKGRPFPVKSYRVKKKVVELKLPPTM